jgi:predicted transcriptional regulator of viral defense system
MVDVGRRAAALLKKKGIATSRELEAAGISRVDLQRLYQRGVVERIARGIYALPGGVVSEHQSLIEASGLVPKGVICLVSALRFHGLTTQNPFEVWMAVEAKAWRPTREAVKIRLVHMSGRSFTEGVEVHRAGESPLRVYNPAKTVADCFKFRNKIGIDVAVEALRDYTRKYRGGANELARYSAICRVSRVMQPYLEAIS